MSSNFFVGLSCHVREDEGKKNIDDCTRNVLATAHDSEDVVKEDSDSSHGHSRFNRSEACVFDEKIEKESCNHSYGYKTEGWAGDQIWPITHEVAYVQGVPD